MVKATKKVDGMGLDMTEAIIEENAPVEKLDAPVLRELESMPEAHQMIRVMPLQGEASRIPWQGLDGEITVYLRNGFKLHPSSGVMRTYEQDGILLGHMYYLFVRE